MKAEELSEKYRAYREKYGIKDPVVLDEIEEAYYEGYLQAEKDLANTREETIKEVCEWLNDHTILSEKWYIEDLKKHFNNMK